MASTSTSTITAGTRRLSELLEEEQEPFVLELYLLERGLTHRSSEFEGRYSCFSSTSNNASKSKNLSKVLKKSASYHGSSSKSSGQFYSNIARSVYSKLVSIKPVIGLESLSKGRKRRNDVDDDDKAEGVAESARFSSASSSTFCHSCSGSDMERESVISSTINPALHEAAPGRVMTQWRFIEDNKQCSPVSVLDEIDLLQEIPIYNNVRHEETPSTSRTQFRNKVSEDLILSATLFELLLQSRKSKPEKGTLPPYMNSRKALHQTRELLFDCVKEVVEMGHKGKQQLSMMKRKQRGLVMGPEEIGKIIGNNLKAWGKLSTDKTSITKLLKNDMLGSTEEWGSLQVYKKEVAWDIGAGILEDITDDFVRDMIEQYCQQLTFTHCFIP